MIIYSSIRQEGVKTPNPVTHCPSDNPASDDVKTPDLSLVPIQGKTYETIEGYLTGREDEYCELLSEAKTLEDVVAIFKMAESDTGFSELTMAKILSCIHGDKLWKRLGYRNELAFISDLEACGVGTRQTYYRAVKVGDLFNNKIFCYFRETLSKEQISRLYKGYSKFPDLARIVLDQSGKVFDGLMEHFFNDSCRDFKKFVNATLLQRQKDRTPDRIGRISDKASLMKVKAGKKIIKTEGLTEIKKRIYREFKLGHRIVFISDCDPAFIASIDSFFERKRSEKLDELNSRSYDAINLHFSNYELSSFLDNFNSIYMELMKCETRYCSGTGEMFSPEVVKRTLRYYARSKMELLLIKAYLIHRIETEQELKDKLVNCGCSSVKEFALNVLEIGISQYKRLKRIGENLGYIEKLEGEIELASVGFMEKIYFLDKAWDNHKPALIVDCLKTLSTKEFRKFARDPSYEFGNEPIANHAYNKLIELFDEYDGLLFEHQIVDIIGITTDQEYEKLREILWYNEPGFEDKRKFFPDISWTDAKCRIVQVA